MTKTHLHAEFNDLMFFIWLSKRGLPHCNSILSTLVIFISGYIKTLCGLEQFHAVVGMQMQVDVGHKLRSPNLCIFHFPFCTYSCKKTFMNETANIFLWFINFQIDINYHFISSFAAWKGVKKVSAAHFPLVAAKKNWVKEELPTSKPTLLCTSLSIINDNSWQVGSKAE